MDNQHNTPSPVRISRADLGQFSSILFALFGFLSILAYFYEGELRPYNIVMIAVSVIFLVLWVLISPSGFVGFITGRQIRYGTSALISSFLVISILTMTYIYVERQVIAYDLTETGSFTLGNTTQQIIDRIPIGMRIIGFYSAENIAVRELDDQYWRQYEIMSNGKIQRLYIDPVEYPAMVEAYNAEDGDVFIALVDETGEIINSTISYVPMEGRHERDMSYAINRLLQQGTFSAFFDTSHGQRNLRDTSSAGISIAGQLLELNGWRVVEFDLKELAENDVPIPDQADVIILSRPREAFTQPIIDLIDDYLARGGSLLILTDPVLANEGFLLENSEFNQYLWSNWGIRALDVVVVEFLPGLNMPTPLDAISYQVFDSPITAGINIEEDPNSRTHFRLARAIDVSDSPPVNNGRAVQSSAYSYGEVNLPALGLNDEYEYDEDEDIVGPLTLVGFAINAETDGRIVLMGDSDFMSDGFIGSPEGNAYLFVGALNWLTKFEESITFGYSQTSLAQPTIFISPAQLDQVTFFVIFLVPSIVLLGGLGTWLYRSRR
jgi:ABC-type uncharacterized transport system involved in gliding motility auxiliary subunit